MFKITRILLLLVILDNLFAQNDSMLIKLPKHYFKSIVLLDYYQKPEVILPSEDYVHQKLKSYQIKQSTIACNIPLYTKDIIKKDSSIANTNLLLIGYFLSYNPNFSGLPEKHILMKNGIGIRFIYNNGKKSIFFVDFSPFSTIDKGYKETRVIRIASLLLWNYSSSSNFSFRLGLTKSFMWGNRYYIPVIGFRIGALSKINFSLQFPRVVSLNFPINNKFHLSLFSKPQGGLFSISNKDSIYTAFLDKNRLVYLGRYELLGGIRVDVKPLEQLALYLSLGRSVNNYLAMYSLSFNKNNQFEYRPFFYNNQKKTPFINIGIVGYFGNTKSYYERYKIDEMIDLNNQIGVGDNSIQVYQTTQNTKRREKFKVSNQEVADLINSFDY